jgi:hypothetical protein
MPSAKSGTAGTLVSPAAPQKAAEADKADPGEVEQAKAGQQQTGTGKYGATPIKPFKPAAADDKKAPVSWIEVVLQDEDGNPVPGEPYSITLADGTVAEGTLDEKGFVRVDGIPPGACQVTFPARDGQDWKKA